MLHRTFEEVAARCGSQTALSFTDGSWSYAELNFRANQVARFIEARGVRPHSLIGVCLDRSPELIAALLGIIKAGCAYVPIDASYPRERIAYMLKDVAAPLFLTDSALAPGLPAGTAALISFDSDASEIARWSGEDLQIDAAPDDLAYVMYTSGSTGTPKGVMVPHCAILSRTVGATYARFSPNEVFLQLAPVSFDASTFEIWGSLLNGARLALPPPGPLSLAETGALIRLHGVTTLWLTAGLFNTAVDQNVEILRPLTQLLTGGDALSPHHVQKAARALPSCTLINGYGPTEATTFACCHKIVPEDLAGGAIPIGRPIEKTEIQLWDAALQPVPDGIAGELVIGGAGVALGYLNQPEMTAERFVRSRIGERLYRTGDLGRRRADGVIEFHGRTDAQVKIAGHRIEPGEIEAVLTALPGVAQAAVCACTSAGGEKRLVAYVVLAARQGTTESELRGQLAEQLPEYLIPSTFQFLEQLPLSPNGKVDRARLPLRAAEPGGIESLRTENPADRADPMGTMVCAVWRKVLGIAQPPADQNFFDLGGDSLLLLSAHAEFERELGRTISLNALFEFSSIRELTAYFKGEQPPHHALRTAGERARKQRAAVRRHNYARAGSL